MILRVYQTLKQPNSTLKHILSDFFLYGIIDEFQDTNALQWDIIQNILLKKRTIYVVGDPKQSIFSFQGSNTFIYQKALQDLRDHQAREYYLNVNFRSTQVLVDEVNQLGKHLFKNANIQYHTISSGFINNEFKLLRNPIDLKVTENISEQLNWVEQTLIELFNQDIKIPQRESGQRSLKPEDICILCRYHSQAKELSSYLEKNNWPILYFNRKGKLQSKFCYQFILLLESIANYDQSQAIVKSMISQFQKIIEAIPLELKENYIQHICYWHELYQQFEWRKLLAELKSWFHKTETQNLKINLELLEFSYQEISS